MHFKYYVSQLSAVVIAIIFFLPAAYGMSVPSKNWQVSENLFITELTDDVWIHTSWAELSSGARFPTNGLIVRHEDEVLLVDTAWGVEVTAELLDWIDTHLKMPVSQVIVTHFHADSMGGTPALAARGIPFYGSSLTQRLGYNEGVPLPESIGELEVGDSVQIANVEVYYPGPGHSEDNLVVWVPHAKILFGSCAVRTPDFSGRGNTADADMDAWPESIQRVLMKYPDVLVVVPGHGRPGDISLLNHTIGLF